MFKIELLLRHRLVKDALSSLLTEAGFSVICVPRQHDYDNDTIVVIDLNDLCFTEIGHADRWRDIKIVGLASEADTLKMRPDEIAPLSGVLTYDSSADAFVRSLRLICSGERVFPPDSTCGQNSLVPSRGTPYRFDGEHLSLREGEVLSHVVAGRSNKVIARRLGTTETTVRVHLNSLFRKIKVDNRTQAAVWAAANLPDLKPPLPGFV